MNQPSKPYDFAAVLKLPDVRLFIGSVGFFTLGGRALLVVIGFQIYQITQSALALGWLGLVEAIPAISLVFLGGHFADHFNRQKILLITRASSVLCALAMAFLSLYDSHASLIGLYAVIFLAGIARGFSDPANTAFEAQVVPKHLTVNAAAWISSTWISCSIIGPVLIGFMFEGFGPVGCYLWIAFCFALSWACTFPIKPRAQAKPLQKEPILKSVLLGWKFVFKNQPLYAAMALDLLAVLFGGTIALLPIFAETILNVGAKGLGFLNAAPALGALVTMLTATRHPPMHKAGRNLLLAVAGFGISIIVFAFSKIFILSMIALFFSGAFDGISMVIRRSMIRLLSPDELRGRIAAANWVFICASNELGAFESGMAAALLGTIPAVALGGCVTLLVVGATAFLAPQLRRLSFDIHSMNQQTSGSTA